MESARKFILKHGNEYQVRLLNMDPLPPGTKALAFQVTDFVELWAENTRELAMDSTCKNLVTHKFAVLDTCVSVRTNRSNCELFAAVAGACGSGVPVAFCLVHTTKEARKGAKQEILTQFLSRLKELQFLPEFTLTDKDWSEINAMRKVWPDSKHHLCFWHALKAVKGRLSKNKSTPTYYNVEKAYTEFSFIQDTFVPAAQQTGSKVNTNASEMGQIY